MEPSAPVWPVTETVSPTFNPAIEDLADFKTTVSGAPFTTTVLPSAFVIVMVVPTIFVMLPDVPRPKPPPPKPPPPPAALVPPAAEAVAVPSNAPPPPPKEERRLESDEVPEFNAERCPYQAPPDAEATTTSKPANTAVYLLVHLNFPFASSSFRLSSSGVAKRSKSMFSLLMT